MLYTRKGDGGTTKLFTTESGKRVSKTATVFEALGTVDELNSFVGFCKAVSDERYRTKDGSTFASIAHDIQKDLFIIQAELGGSDMTISEDKTLKLESITNAIEAELPPITTFFIPGATEVSARYDVARTIARRAERIVVRFSEEGGSVGPETLRYLNRLSSVLYAFARLSSHISGITEEPPNYT